MDPRRKAYMIGKIGGMLQAIEIQAIEREMSELARTTRVQIDALDEMFLGKEAHVGMEGRGSDD